eukprot:2540761-Rhodomonas_salina.1
MSERTEVSPNVPGYCQVLVAVNSRSFERGLDLRTPILVRRERSWSLKSSALYGQVAAVTVQVRQTSS